MREWEREQEWNQKKAHFDELFSLSWCKLPSTASISFSIYFFPQRHNSSRNKTKISSGFFCCVNVILRVCVYLSVYVKEWKRERASSSFLFTVVFACQRAKSHSYTANYLTNKCKYTLIECGWIQRFCCCCFFLLFIFSFNDFTKKKQSKSNINNNNKCH